MNLFKTAAMKKIKVVLNFIIEFGVVVLISLCPECSEHIMHVTVHMLTICCLTCVMDHMQGNNLHVSTGKMLLNVSQLYTETILWISKIESTIRSQNFKKLTIKSIAV